MIHVEVTRFFPRHGFANVPLLRFIEYHGKRRSRPSFAPCSLPSAAKVTLTNALDPSAVFYRAVPLARKADLQSDLVATGSIVNELIGGVYPERAKLLGRRTAELHLALASEQEDKRSSRSPSTPWGSALFFKTARPPPRSWELWPGSCRICRRLS